MPPHPQPAHRGLLHQVCRAGGAAGLHHLCGHHGQRHHAGPRARSRLAQLAHPRLAHEPAQLPHDAGGDRLHLRRRPWCAAPSTSRPEAPRSVWPLPGRMPMAPPPSWSTSRPASTSSGPWWPSASRAMCRRPGSRGSPTRPGALVRAEPRPLSPPVLGRQGALLHRGLRFYNYPYLFGYLFSLGVYQQLMSRQAAGEAGWRGLPRPAARHRSHERRRAGRTAFGAGHSKTRLLAGEPGPGGSGGGALRPVRRLTSPDPVCAMSRRGMALPQRPRRAVWWPEGA